MCLVNSSLLLVLVYYFVTAHCDTVTIYEYLSFFIIIYGANIFPYDKIYFGDYNRLIIVLKYMRFYYHTLQGELRNLNAVRHNYFA